MANQGIQSIQLRDQQQAKVDALKGSIAADEAAMHTARLNLAYANIRAPFDGRTGTRLVDIGNLVQASQATRLVSITQIKPIFVNFTVPQDVNDDVRRNQAQGALTVIAYGSNEAELARGKLSVIDNQIDPTTGTLRLKATFEQRRRASVAGTIRQCAPGAVDAVGYGDRAAARRHAGRQRLFLLRREGRRHGRAAGHRDRRRPGWRRRHHARRRRRRECRDRRPVPPDRRGAGQGPDGAGDTGGRRDKSAPKG